MNEVTLLVSIFDNGAGYGAISAPVDLVSDARPCIAVVSPTLDGLMERTIIALNQHYQDGPRPEVLNWKFKLR